MAAMAMQAPEASLAVKPRCKGKAPAKVIPPASCIPAQNPLG
jgi:hypothetical protein